MNRILKFTEYIKEGSLPQKSTVTQLKKLRDIMKKEIGGDIGDKISDMNKQGANIHYIQNPIETGIESIQDYMKIKPKKRRKKRKKN